MPKCINISAREAGKLDKLPENCFLISINEEYEGYHHLQFDNEEDRLLRVRFTDITCDMEHKGKRLSPISIDTAHQIINFVEKHKGKGAIVHCHAGISRSSAVCMFLHIAYGYELRESYFDVSEPNAFVLGRLLIEWKKKQFKYEPKILSTTI